MQRTNPVLPAAVPEAAVPSPASVLSSGSASALALPPASVLVSEEASPDNHARDAFLSARRLDELLSGTAPVPSWLRPFTMASNARFTRTPDYMIRGRSDLTPTRETAESLSTESLTAEHLIPEKPATESPAGETLAPATDAAAIAPEFPAGIATAEPSAAGAVAPLATPLAGDERAADGAAADASDPIGEADMSLDGAGPDCPAALWSVASAIRVGDWLWEDPASEQDNLTLEERPVVPEPVAPFAAPTVSAFFCWPALTTQVKFGAFEIAALPGPDPIRLPEPEAEHRRGRAGRDRGGR